jgi:hypothetical protein
MLSFAMVFSWSNLRLHGIAAAMAMSQKTAPVEPGGQCQIIDMQTMEEDKSHAWPAACCLL